MSCPPDTSEPDIGQGNSGGIEACTSAIEDALTSLEVGEQYSENLKKMTFISGIVDVPYTALHDILIEDDIKTYTDCFLALREKALDTQENCRGHVRK